MRHQGWGKYPVLFALYIAQSIPMAFFSTVLPIIMRMEHYSLSSIGLLQLIKIPWILKFLWAPLIDNHAPDRTQLKRLIIKAELFYALVMVLIGLLHLKTDFTLILVLIIIAFIISATQDIAVDRYAILSLVRSERSIGNSMQSSGSFVGSLFGTGVLLILYHHIGWQLVLMLLAMIILAALIPLLLFKERNKVREESLDAIRSVSLKDIGSFIFNEKQTCHVLLLLFYYSSIIGIMSMMKPFMVDHGYTLSQIAIMVGIYGSSIAAVCAILGGFIMRKIGRIRSLWLFLIASGLTTMFFTVFSIMPLLSDITLWLGITLLWGVYGFSTVAIYTIAMDRVRGGCEGTDFTLQIVLTHLSSILIAILSGQVGDYFGYTTLFIFEGLMCLFTMLILYKACRTISY